MSTKTRDIAPGAAKKCKGQLDRLEKSLGSLKMLKDAPALEQALYLILREGTDFRKANKAMKLLEEEYVEWNELRVATPKEVIAVLKPTRLGDLEDKVSRMLALLSRLFYDFHKKDLEFVKIFEGPQREKIMLSLDPLPLHLTYVLLQHFDEISMDPQGIVVSQDAVARVTKKGWIRKTTSPNVARKLLGMLVADEDWYRFQYYIHRWEP